MKKMCAAFAAIMTIATLLLLFGCSKDYMENVSERRSGYYTASDGTFTVTAVSGVRETPYTADGVVGELKPYTLITVVPSVFDVDAIYTYTAKAGDNVYGGALTVHPFAASFSAEFDAEVTGEDFIVEIQATGAKSAYTLKSLVTPAMMTYDRAIDAAKTALDPTGSYEIRVRIMKNPIDESGVCWHVAFYADSDRMSGVLLDPVTAKVLAKKE